MVNVLGIDASPTATGIAMPDGSTLTFTTVKITDKEMTGPRLLAVRRQIREVLENCQLDAAVIEGYNFGLRTFGPVFQIGETAGIIKVELADRGIPLIRVSPAARSQYGCGKGGQNKKTVKTSWEALTKTTFSDDNQCDAHILQEIGLAVIGKPRYGVDSARLMALTKVIEVQRSTIEDIRNHLR